MSRSYKHFPLFRDCLWGKSMKQGKRLFNRKFRRSHKDFTKECPNGNYYRKINSNYELYEYKHYQTRRDIIDDWERAQKEIANGINTWKSKYRPTLEEALNDWKSSYVRK